MGRIIYHGGRHIARQPEIRNSKYDKDFSIGFYCTVAKEQSVRRSIRYPGIGYVNEFVYEENPDLRVKRFENMTEEWLDFIASCRSGENHDFDVVEGPMADDSIFNYVQDFIDGNISREAFWALAKFKKPTHQICFHTPESLKTLSFRSYEIHENR